MLAPYWNNPLGWHYEGFLWAVNPKAEPVEIDSHSTPKVLPRGLLTVPHVATRAVI
jgi:hypothetical protein